MITAAVDSNFILSFLTDRDPQQQDVAQPLIVAASRGAARVLIPQFVLFEITHVLRSVYKSPPSAIAEILSATLELDGADVIDTLRWDQVLKLWPASVAHFTDATMTAFAMEMNCSVATFNGPFIKELQQLGVPVWRAA